MLQKSVACSVSEGPNALRTATRGMPDALCPLKQERKITEGIVVLWATGSIKARKFRTHAVGRCIVEKPPVICQGSVVLPMAGKVLRSSAFRAGGSVLRVIV